MGVRAGLHSPPKTMCRFLLLFLSLTTVIVGTRAQAGQQSCDATLPVSITDNITVTNCQLLETAYSTLWFNTTAETFSAVLSVPKDTRWYGMGFNSASVSMSGTHAMIFWADATTAAPEVGSYILREGNPGNKTSSALNYLSEPNVYVDSDYWYLYFALNQSMSDPMFTYIYFARGNAGSIPASGRDTVSSVSSHDYLPVKFNYTSGSGIVVKSDTDSLRKNHGILNIIGWGVLLPAGAIIARYARAYHPTWFYLHAGFQLVGYVFVIAGFILGYQLENKLPSEAADFDTHKAIGIVLFVLATIQISAAVIRPKKDAKLRRYWNWGHWWLGRTGLLLAAINIFVGIHIASAGKKWKLAYGLIVAHEILIAIVLETLLWIRYLRKPAEPRLPQTVNMSSLSRRNMQFQASARHPPPPPPFEVAKFDSNGEYSEYH